MFIFLYYGLRILYSNEIVIVLKISNVFYSICKDGTAPKNMMRRENDHPYIVEYGSSKKDISRFHIEIEKHLIPVYSHLRSFVELYDLTLNFWFVFSFRKNLIGYKCLISFSKCTKFSI